MIKIGQEGPQGWVVILGLSRENLRLALEEAQPIAFPASQVGLGPGRLGLGTRGSREALEEVLGEPLAGFLELTEDVARTLVSGQVYTTDLGSLGFEKAGDLALLAGEDEDHIVDAFRAAGLVSADTRIIDESEGLEVPRTSTPAPTPRAPRSSRWAIVPSGLMMAVGLALLVDGRARSLGTAIVLSGVAFTLWVLHGRKPAC
ncbi:MAG: hypothetical protein HOO96_30580 [Polyangiaceae bacterium]|nr:hypothetical protein [Polyangiaceae bacterium]